MLIACRHKTRYSDLRKFIYRPTQTFSFKPLEQQSAIDVPGLDGLDAFSFVHPVSSLVDKSRGIPDDLSLEARDCLTLYEALLAYHNERFPLSPNLAPSKALPEVVRKADILRWEQDLKSVLKQWMKDDSSPFDSVLAALSANLAESTTSEPRESSSGSLMERSVDAESRSSTTLPLLVDLHNKNALPAILFNYDRSDCEHIAQEVLDELKSNEDKWKTANAAWKKKLAAWQEWKEIQSKNTDKAKKSSASKAKGKKKQSSTDEEDMDKIEQLQETADQQGSWKASFDPETPVEGLHFANWKTLLPSEFDDHRKVLARCGVQQWLIKALERGVGVHHAGRRCP